MVRAHRHAAGVRFDGVAVTERACAPEIMAVERTFLDKFGRMTSLSRDDDETLRLIGPEADTLATYRRIR